MANGTVEASHSDNEDVVQELLIGLWAALGKYDADKGALPSYLTRGAKLHLSTVRRNRAWTGQETTKGVRRDDRDRPTESLDELAELSPARLPGVLEDVSLAYHHGEIHRAVASLAPPYRRYVWLRFWGGYTDREIAHREGRDVSSMWRAQRGIRDQLRGQLAHLEECA